jgi:hypothetical protein
MLDDPNNCHAWELGYRVDTNPGFKNFHDLLVRV